MKNVKNYYYQLELASSMSEKKYGELVEENHKKMAAERYRLKALEKILFEMSDPMCKEFNDITDKIYNTRKSILLLEQREKEIMHEKAEYEANKLEVLLEQ